MERNNDGVAWLIHHKNTPRTRLTGGVPMFWHGTGWGVQGCYYTTQEKNTTELLPIDGEWVQVLVEVTA